MYELEIQHTNSDYRGVFSINKEGKTIASLTYTLKNPIMTIDHTEVNRACEGNGLGAKLVAQRYVFAKNNDFKVNPLCPFTAVVFLNNPSWSAVRL